jgi:hypothetical protein
MPSFEISERDSSSKLNTKNQQQSSTKFLPAYDSSLIGALQSDHEEIIYLYDKVLNAAMNKEYASLQLLLVEFASSFTNHIHVEDVKLYGFLKTLVRNKCHLEQRVVANFCSEMKNTSISIFTFLSQSPYIPVKENTLEYFIKEFSEIGVILQDRIEREERILYPIYRKSRKVINIS